MPEVDPPAPGGPPATTPPPDFASPAFQSYVQQEKAKAVSDAAGRWELDKTAILKNKDEILEEKKKYDALRSYGDPELIAKRLKDAEDRDLELAAQGLGADPKKTVEEIDRRAQIKFESWKTENSALMKAKDEKIEGLDKKLGETEREIKLSFAAKELVLAAMPPELQFVQPGAWDHLIESVAKVMEKVEIPGVPGPVARFKFNGAFMPGSGPDGLMTPAEFLTQARSGQGPFGHLAYCFVSKGQGSGTVTPQGGSVTPGNWWDMTGAEQDKFVNEHSREEVQDFIDRSKKKQQRAA